MNLANLKEEYEKNGIVILKNFLHDDLTNNFKVEIEQYAKYLCNKHNIFSNDYLNDGLIQLDKKDHSQIHLLYNVIRDSTSLNQIVYNKEIIKTIKYLLNIEYTAYVKYHIVRIDPPKDERFLYKWHQESFYSIPNTPSIQLWAPLINCNNEENGTIDVLLGSHKEELPHYIEKVPNGHTQLFIKDEDIKKQHEFLKAELSPSDIVLFHPYLIHKSNSNFSEKIRYSLVSHYVNPQNDNFYLEENHFIDINRQKCENYDSFFN